MGDIPSADAGFPPLSRDHAQVLQALEGTTATNPLKTRQVCLRTFGEANGSLEDKTSRMLERLEAQGRVLRKRRRSGWYLVPTGPVSDPPQPPAARHLVDASTLSANPLR
jgi:hypothetical protein